VMEILQAAIRELYATASGWHTLAGELTGAAPTESGLSFQSSAAAVIVIHAGVAATSGVLTTRTQVTAVKTAAATIAYTENEATSAALLDVLSESL
jgi:predicted solute-binding protein